MLFHVPPIYDKTGYNSAAIRCLNTGKPSTYTDVYVMEPDICHEDSFEMRGFFSLPCAYGNVLGNGVEEFCQWTKNIDHVILGACSDSPPIQLGYIVLMLEALDVWQPNPLQVSTPFGEEHPSLRLLRCRPSPR